MKRIVGLLCVYFLCIDLCFPILAQEPSESTATEQTRLLRTRRGMRSRAVLPSGIFGAEKPNTPDAARTVLGGTVPALWELKRGSLEMDDENLPGLLERNTMAPPVPGKVIRYAARLLQHYDSNADGILQEEEWKKMPGAPQAMDIDGDREITLEELIRFTALYGQDRTIHHPQPVERYYQPRLVSSQFQLFKPVSPPPELEIPADSEKTAPNTESDLTEDIMGSDETPIDDATYEEIIVSRQIPAVRKYNTARESLHGVPAWFIIRDQDGDGQVSLKEFAPSLSAASLALFGRLDKNGDGFITPDEVRTPEVRTPSVNENKSEPQP